MLFYKNREVLFLKHYKNREKSSNLFYKSKKLSGQLKFHVNCDINTIKTEAIFIYLQIV